MDIVPAIIISILLIAVGVLFAAVIDLRWRQRVSDSRLASMDGAVRWIGQGLGELRTASGERGAAARELPFEVQGQGIDRLNEDGERTAIYSRAPASGAAVRADAAPTSSATLLSPGGAPRPGKP